MENPNYPSSSLVAALQPGAGLLETLAYQLNGLVVVFCALGSIWGVMELIGWFFRMASQRTVRRAAERVARAAAPEPNAAQQIPAESIAVIAAAVAASLGTSRYVIHAINPSGPDPTWAREGRREVFHSHKIR